MTRTITVIVVASGAAMLGLAAPRLASPVRVRAKTERRCDGVLGAVAPGACTRAHAHPGHAGVAGYIPYRLYSTIYPVPYKYEYPGRGTCANARRGWRGRSRDRHRHRAAHALLVGARQLTKGCRCAALIEAEPLGACRYYNISR